MKVKSISATSIQTFEGCTARFQAEVVDHVPSPTGSSYPARLGSAVHDTLEIVVGRWYVKKESTPSFPELVAFFKQKFMEHFEVPPSDESEWYKEGLDMLETWFGRNDLDNVEILHLEEKMEIEFQSPEGPVPFRFIFDRLDRFQDGDKKVLRVVDYKTWRQNLQPEGLRQKAQARLYAMAAQIAFKHIEFDEIWVCFDQLRYECVEVPFSVEENRATWKYVMKTIKRIQAEPSPGKRTLNSECQFCVIKSTCSEITRNIKAGGTMALAGDRNAMAQRLMELDGAAKAIKYAQEEVQELLLQDAMEYDEIEYETEDFHVAFKSMRRKTYNPNEVREIIGDNLFASLGKINNGEIDKLLKGDVLTPSQKSLLRSSVNESVGEPRPKIIKKLIKE